MIAAIGALLLIGLAGAAAAADQTAFNGPHTIPGRVQAEDYDNGGATVAYSDTTPENIGGAGRMAEGVDVRLINGITDIAYIPAGEWTEYTVTVPAGGSYTANFRVGAIAAGRQVTVTVDGAPGCTVNVPNTGSYQTYQTVSAPLALTAGTHVVRLAFTTGFVSVDWFEVVGGAVPTQSGQTAFNGPHAVPGRVQAEDYDNGGATVAYSDTTPENIGGAGRTAEGVDVRLINGITDIAYIPAGEWTEYTVTVPAGGSYTANFRVGAIAAGRQVTVTVDGAPGCTVNVPNTGSYQTYQTVSAPLTLTPGTHVIRLAFTTGFVSIDWFEILSGSAPTVAPTTAAPTTVPTIVSTTAPTVAPTTVAPTSGGGISPSPSTAELQSRLDSAKSAGTARLAAMRSAYQAWKVPATGMPAGATDVQTAGIRADGVTDNTAALQALLNARPAGSTLYFPAGTYRINGPVSISKAVTILGTAGTVFDCTRASGNVFTVNKGGSLSSKLSGVTFSGIVINGPGIETGPTMIDGYYLQNFHVKYMKFRNIGYGAVRVKGCSDVVVEDCVFDNVYRTGYGYGVVILDYSDNITVRDSFFVTKGRHGVATGTATTGLPVAGYIKRVTVENNYFENFTDQAMDAHDETTGPYVARNNVVVNSRVGINTRNGLTELYDNVFVSCTSGILLRNNLVSASSIGSKVDKVVGNTIIGGANGMQVDKTNSAIQNNVIQGTGIGIYFGPSSYTPRSAVVSGNVEESCSDGFTTLGGMTGVSLTNNWLKAGTSWQRVS